MIQLNKAIRNRGSIKKLLSVVLALCILLVPVMDVSAAKLKYNGGTYTGTVKSGKMNGQGTFIDKNGTIYKGTFVNNLLTGQGSCKLKNGEVYTGIFKNNKLNGKGTYKDKSGYTYSGTFTNNMLNGKGSYTDKEGGVSFGSFNNNILNGKGTYLILGTKYVGNFVNGLLEGKVDMFFTDGTVVYGEEFKNGNTISEAITGRVSNEAIDMFNKADRIYAYVRGEIINPFDPANYELNSGVYRNGEYLEYQRDSYTTVRDSDGNFKEISVDQVVIDYINTYPNKIIIQNEKYYWDTRNNVYDADGTEMLWGDGFDTPAVERTKYSLRDILNMAKDFNSFNGIDRLNYCYKAIDCYKKAIEINSQYYEALLSLARENIIYFNDTSEEDIDELNKVIKMFPNKPEPYFDLADIYLKYVKDYKAAQTNFELSKKYFDNRLNINEYEEFIIGGFKISIIEDKIEECKKNIRMEQLAKIKYNYFPNKNAVMIDPDLVVYDAYCPKCGYKFPFNIPWFDSTNRFQEKFTCDGCCTFTVIITREVRKNK